MIMQNGYWNNEYGKYTPKKPKYDIWLDKYIDVFEQSRDTPIIDLGCGQGSDSLYLSERFYKVISCDISEVAIKRVKEFIPEVETRLVDMLEGLPFDDASAKIIIADLSLHYFHWKDTVNIVNEIWRVLKPNGYLFCRLNSVNDTNYGAGQGDFVEENYYFTEGNMKRFFDREQIERLFNGWQFRYIDEYQMDRYKLPKILWEIAISKECE